MRLDQGIELVTNDGIKQIKGNIAVFLKIEYNLSTIQLVEGLTMASPTLMEVRACIIEAHHDGCTQIEIPQRYGVSQSTVSKLIKKFTKDQHLLPGKAKGNAPLIKKDGYKIVNDIVSEKPEITLAGIQEQIFIRLNKSVSITTA